MSISLQKGQRISLSKEAPGLAVLLQFRRECARAEKRFVVQGLPQRLRDLAALYGIEGLLTSA